MGAQSFIMMFQAGEGWQYGKRRISAMSNEDFNKLTPERLLQNQAVTLRSSISTIERSMNAMTPMVGTIVAQYGDFVKEIIKVLPKVSQDVVKEVINSIPEGGFPGEGDKQILAWLKNFLNIPEAEAQLPSSDLFEVDTSKVVIPPPPIITKTGLLTEPQGFGSKGFLGGPAPGTLSIAERFRQFTRTGTSGEKASLQRKLSQLQQAAGQWREKIRINISRMGSARSTVARDGLNHDINRWKVFLTSIERDIRLTKIQISRL